MKQLELFTALKQPEKSWFYEWEIDCSDVEEETQRKNSPTKPSTPPSKKIPPSNKTTPPSKIPAHKNTTPPSKTRRKKGDGTGYIYRRTITRRGKQYQESYYRYRDLGGKLRAKYIPKKLLDLVQKAESRKLPIKDILVLLGGDGISRGEQSSSSNGVQAKDDRINRGEQLIPPSTKPVKQPPGNEYNQSPKCALKSGSPRCKTRRYSLTIKKKLHFQKI